MSAADYVVVALLAAVLCVLVMGVVTMMIGKNPQRSNRLMMWRVVLQGLVIVIAALFLVSKK